MNDMRRQFPEHSALLSSLRRDSIRSIVDQMDARGDDPEPYQPTENSSSSSSGQRAQDAVILQSERIRQAVEWCQSNRR